MSLQKEFSRICQRSYDVLQNTSKWVLHLGQLSSIHRVNESAIGVFESTIISLDVILRT